MTEISEIGNGTVDTGLEDGAVAVARVLTEIAPGGAVAGTNRIRDEYGSEILPEGIGLGDIGSGIRDSLRLSLVYF